MWISPRLQGLTQSHWYSALICYVKVDQHNWSDFALLRSKKAYENGRGSRWRRDLSKKNNNKNNYSHNK